MTDLEQAALAQGLIDAGVEQRLMMAVRGGEDPDARIIYADWLEERGQVQRSLFMRLEMDKLDANWLFYFGWVVVGKLAIQIPSRTDVLGFRPVRFAAGGIPRVEVYAARPQRDFRVRRLIADYTRSGATATGSLTLEGIRVGAKETNFPGVPVGALGPATMPPMNFGTMMTARAGEDISVVLLCEPMPQGDDVIDVSMVLFGELADLENQP